jgi:Animal haem peroxidase/RTX calcium-binding nonapeptide repeat (4 copies)
MFNNLLPGNDQLGAADTLFPRLTDPNFQTVDGPGIDFNGDGIVDVVNHIYGDASATPGVQIRSVADTDPRVISNLIVDMSVNNPAAIDAFLNNPLSIEAFVAATGLAASQAEAWLTNPANAVAANELLKTIPNQSPDIGLSPGFNSWMTFFGQFFDHGLDLVTKGKNGTVYIPLQADDPLYDKGKDGIANNVVNAYFVSDPTGILPGAPLPAVSGVVTQWQAFYATDPADRSLYAPGAFAPVITATPTAYAVKFNDDGFGADGLVGTADDRPNFMALTRATATIDANGVPQHENTTTSWVDQNQTYTSHESHQVFLREYIRVDADGTGPGTAQITLATGKLLSGSTAGQSVAGAIGNWGEVKAQSVAMLGLKLSDFDVHDVPLLKADQYGKFIAGANGYAQVAVKVEIVNTITGAVVSAAGTAFVEGISGGLDVHALTTANLPSGFTLPALGANQTYKVSTIGTGHAFLNDIAHHATPGMYDADGDGFKESQQVADTLAGTGDDGLASTYDDEMLNSHFVTGDGRGNENIALTSVHSIFHSEHDRLVDANKATILDSGNLAFINEWLRVDLTAAQLADIDTPEEKAALIANVAAWDGERLFQAARFTTEMQYQHLVFEEFARRIQPMVDPFIFNNSPDVDPRIVAEFAHTVYRYGHSMLTGTVDRLENDLTTVNGETDQKSLLAVFLNPQQYYASGTDVATINANLIRGLTRDVANEIDELIVSDVRSSLLGLPLDLAALNIARGRDTGIPSLNDTRSQLYNDSGLADLKPYTSWADFAEHIKNPLSIVNFIAAYGTHSTIASATTVADKRAAAEELVFGIDGPDSDGTVPADRLNFLNATGVYAGGSLGGLNNVDLWIGGLAEAKNEFGGMLGSTFNYVFEAQMENLQNGDRMYYLTRTQGLNILNNLEPNTFSDLVMRNTALGDKYSTHLNGALFVTPDHILELDKKIAQEDYGPIEYNGTDPGSDPTWAPGEPHSVFASKVTRDYTTAVRGVAPTVGTDGHNVGGTIKFIGGEHVVLGGTEGNDALYSDRGIDTIWGDGGNDYINAGTESDDVFGGEGDDIIEDPFGDDVLRGNQGNDVITSARGADLLFGDEGSDFISLGQDAAEAFGGEGDDFILGGDGKDFILGNEGNDWIEGGKGFDTLAGDNSELFFNSTIIGHDVMFNQGDEGDYDAESGDDIMGSGASVFRYEGMFGFDWAIGKGDSGGVDFDAAIPIFTTIPNDILKDRFDQVEAFSGNQYDDKLSGDDRGHKGGGSSAPDSIPVELFADHLLTQEGINRIDGFNAWFGGFDGTDARQTLFGGASPVPGSTPVSTFRDGNILMGGDGNDNLRGRGGYDLLDGDAYLNVRIKINLNGTIYSAESLNTDTTQMGQHAGKVFNVFTAGDELANPQNVAGQPNFASPAFGGRSLQSLLLDGTVNPSQMSIVREILTDNTNVTGLGQNIDTAIFQGTLAEYDIEGRTADGINGTGQVLTQAHDVDGDGFIYVRDRDTGAVGATIIGSDGVTPVTLSSRGLLTDDRDLLKNIEQLQFADQTIIITGPNRQATGTVTIGDPTPYDGKVTPYVGQVLVPTLTGVADLDGIPINPGTGLPVGLNFEWQTTEFGSNSGWSTIQTSQTYTVRSVDPGHVLRAVAVFKDSNGITERIFSEGTDNPTVAFSVDENSLSNTVVGLQIPFSVDYDSQSIGGQPPVDVDLATLYHAIDPLNSAGGRFKVIPNGVDFNGFPRYSLVVDNGGPVLLDYEAIQGPVDNQYQVVINTYSDNPANGGVLVAVRQFTIFLNDVANEIVGIAPTDIQWNGVTPGDGTAGLGNLANGLPGANAVIANLSTVDDPGTPTGHVYSLVAAGSSAGFAVSAAGVVTRTGSAMAANTTYTLNISSTDTTGMSRTETFTIRTGTNSVVFGANGVDTITADATDNVIYGSGANDTLTGLGGNDNLFGQAGNDTLNGGIGNDILVGGGGTDTVNGDAGNDTIRHTVGDGGGAVNGGADSDTLAIAGTAANNNLTVTYNGTAITNFDGGTATNVESVTADLGAGTDTLTYTAPGGVTVNLAAGTASGFTSIANIENVTSNGGSDTLIGSAVANVLSGGGAADVINGGGGNDTLNGEGGNDTLNGDADNDTLVGGGGADILTGGLGNDIFRFDQATESGVGTGNRDIITDFLTGADIINLATIDANGTGPGNTAFSNVFGANGAAFTAAGQMRFTQIDTDLTLGVDSTVLRFNTDANVNTTEFEILLQGYTGPLVAANFTL